MQYYAPETKIDTRASIGSRRLQRVWTGPSPGLWRKPRLSRIFIASLSIVSAPIFRLFRNNVVFRWSQNAPMPWTAQAMAQVGRNPLWTRCFFIFCSRNHPQCQRQSYSFLRNHPISVSPVMPSLKDITGAILLVSLHELNTPFLSHLLVYLVFCIIHALCPGWFRHKYQSYW